MAQRHTTIIRGGHVVTLDETIGDLPVGDVLVEDGVITVVGPAIEHYADDVIDAAGTFVLPGLIDTHIHLWQTILRGMASGLWKGEYFERVLPFRSRFGPDDVYAGGYVGGLELLANGVTTAVDFCDCVLSPAHADAAVDGLAAAGIRGFHAYSVRTDEADRFTREQRLGDAARLCGQVPDRGAGRLGFMVALTDVGATDIEVSAREAALARELGVRMTMHAGTAGQVTAMHEAGLLGSDLILVHCNVVTDDELDLLADAGAAISVTPGLELAYGSPFTMLGRAVRRGVPVVWGCDIPSFTNADLIAQLRLAYHVQACLDGAAERADGRSGQRRPGVPTMTPRDFLRGATVDAARALGLDGCVGSFSPGKQADVVLLRQSPFGPSLCDPAAHLLFQSGVQDVDTVLVAGQVRKRHGRLCAAVPGEMIDSARSRVLS